MSNFQIYFTTKAYIQLLTEIADYPYVETGGVFVGQRRKNTFYIFETIDPGFKANRQRAEFSRHYEYTEHLAYKVTNQYEGKTTVIGYYHRHPGNYDHFSSGDDISNLEFAQAFNGIISGLVNIDPNFRLAFYYISPEGNQSKAISYKVDDSVFDGIMVLKSEKNLLVTIHNQENNYIVPSNELNFIAKKVEKNNFFLIKIKKLFSKKKYDSEFSSLTQKVFAYIKDDIKKLEIYSPQISFRENNAISLMSLKINDLHFIIVFKILNKKIFYAFLKNENIYPKDEQFSILKVGAIYKVVDEYISKID